MWQYNNFDSTSLVLFLQLVNGTRQYHHSDLQLKISTECSSFDIESQILIDGFEIKQSLTNR